MIGIFWNERLRIWWHKARLLNCVCVCFFFHLRIYSLRCTRRAANKIVGDFCLIMADDVTDMNERDPRAWLFPAPWTLKAVLQSDQHLTRRQRYSTVLHRYTVGPVSLIVTSSPYCTFTCSPLSRVLQSVSHTIPLRNPYPDPSGKKGQVKCRSIYKHQITLWINPSFFENQVIRYLLR
jgi:hypothetical protein